eukprot:g7340.t1
MRACGRAGKWEIALALMDVMQDQEMVLDEVIYGTAIQACERARKWQHALALLVTLLPVERARQEEGPQVDFLGLTEEDWDVIESLEDETSDPRMEFLWDEFKDLYGIEEEEEEVTPDSAVEAVLRTLEVQENSGAPHLSQFTHLQQHSQGSFSRLSSGSSVGHSGADGLRRDTTGFDVDDVLDKGDLVVDTPLINAVTWAMTCAKCWTRALEMRQVLDNQSLRPSTVTFNTLLTACVQARAAAACQALLQDAWID